MKSGKVSGQDNEEDCGDGVAWVISRDGLPRIEAAPKHEIPPPTASLSRLPFCADPDFFAVTGSWQIFNWHQSTKDRSYVAPRALAILSVIHKDAHIPPTERSSPAPVRYFMFAAALGLVTTSLVGVIMAYRFSRQPLVATICLAIGILVPAGLLWIYQ